MTAIYQFYLAFLTISKSALLANPAYNIENWPVQADVPSPAYNWTEPHRELTQRPTPARVTDNADLSTSADGFLKFQLYWKFWTLLQMGYLLDTAFSGANVYASLSIPVTVQVYFETDYVAFHALLARPVWGVDYKTGDNGYEDILLKFSRATIIT